MVQLDADANVSSTLGKSELNILAKDFPYKEFMDQELMAPTTLVAFHGDEDDLVEKLQWAGRVLLKSTVVCCYSESIVTSGFQA